MMYLLKLLSLYKQLRYKYLYQIDKNVIFGIKSKLTAKRHDQISISEDSYIHCHITCSENGSVSIGRHCSIRYNTILESEKSITIGNYVIISNNVIITDNNSHSTSFRQRRKMLDSGEYGQLWSWNNSTVKPIIIEDDVWIGRNTMILKGVKIGKASIIASGSVVSKDVPAYSLCFGNPCVIQKGKFKDEKEN